MAFPRNRTYAPEWMSTVSAMIRHQTRVICTCGACAWWERVEDLTPYRELLGDDGSLWDRRPPCPECGALAHFMASPGQGTPMRPLKSPCLISLEELPPQAWMGGWTGLG